MNARCSNISLAGPDAPLSQRSGLALAMTFHELATNAAAYGQFSTPNGPVDVTRTLWRDDHGDTLAVKWRVSGGPPVSPPSRRNFGSRMIEQVAAQELQGWAKLHFDPAGVIWRLDIPMPEPAPEEAAAAFMISAAAPKP